MKQVNESLETYLNTEKNLISCDLFELYLQDGSRYYYTDADINLTYDGKTYLHDKLLLKRQQVKIHDSVVVDTMTVNLYATNSTKLGALPLFAAAHAGTLDCATLYLKRCFFRGDAVIGVIDLFGGSVEVKKCGGLNLELTVKAKTQGLSQEFPRRKYYPQGIYSTVGDRITASTDSTDDCLITPFVPLKEVLL
jgi:hypothetical protein